VGRFCVGYGNVTPWSVLVQQKCNSSTIRNPPSRLSTSVTAYRIPSVCRTVLAFVGECYPSA